ncbi:MAG: hypothetical protein MZW92_01660 [Comamonadaceae bacterium]|nr:hypothetical protein [Comamonadaceae bacterium]
MFFLPRRPYLPLGTLRAALTYPQDPQAVADTVVRGALDRVGLDHLAPRLDERRAWDEELSGSERQRLGFARLLLSRPRWIFIQQATEDLDAETEAAMMRLLQEEFPAAAVVTVGRGDGLAAFHPRRLLATPGSSDRPAPGT